VGTARAKRKTHGVVAGEGGGRGGGFSSGTNIWPERHARDRTSFIERRMKKGKKTRPLPKRGAIESGLG